MFSPSRRAFLGASLAGLASAPIFGASPLFKKPANATLFRPSTLFLTWQRDPTTTMTIQWVGKPDETADTTIYYRPVERRFGFWQRQPIYFPRRYANSNLNLYRAELAGLTPGTDYQFQIGELSPTWFFRTMPAKATNTIQFISGGDCGTNPHAIANNIQAARQDPMFVVIGGDLGYDNGTSLETSLAFIRNYSKHMVDRAGRLIPMVACIGNHEVQGGYKKHRKYAPYFYALFDGLYPETGFATLDCGNYLSLVLLDTGHTTPIAGLQTDWLEKTLRERVDCPNVFAVNHVPAYPSARPMLGANGKEGTGDGNRKHWVPLFERYRVPVVLEHHDHTFKRTKPLLGGLNNKNGVLYLGDGSWGQIRAPRKPEKLPLLAVTSQDYHLSLHRIEGEERFHLALAENGRVMDVCRSAQRLNGATRVSG